MIKNILLALSLVLMPSMVLAESEQPLVIDVRTQAEWQQGHLDEAILIPHTEIGEQIVEYTVDLEQPIYLYCRSGNRAGYAQTILQSLGYENVYNLGSLAQAASKLERPIIND